MTAAKAIVAGITMDAMNGEIGTTVEVVDMTAGITRTTVEGPGLRGAMSGNTNEVII
jgi:hypothetical protein